MDLVQIKHYLMKTTVMEITLFDSGTKKEHTTYKGIINPFTSENVVKSNIEKFPK